MKAKIIIAIILKLALVSCTSDNSNILVDGCGKPNDVTEVKICNQVWMTKNLDVDRYRNGDPIRHAQTDEEWVDAGSKGEGAWCYYDNDTANGVIFGKLYNWYAVNDLRGLAPDGWHIASDDEWKELERCLGMQQSELENSRWRGTNE